MESLTAILENLWSPFVQPSDSRVYYPFLLSTLILAIGFYLFTVTTAKNFRHLIRYLFPKSIWWHTSAQVDYQLFVFNTIIKVLLVVPYTLSHVQFMWIVVNWWREAVGWQEQPFVASPLVLSIGYTIIFLLLADFSRFILHYALHKIPMLWQFHQVHHAAEVMTPITLYRIHPIEYFLIKLRNMLVFGVVAGTFYFWFQTSISPINIYQIHLGVFVFNLLGANLRHSHIPISFGRIVEHFIISPAQHQIHHSKATKHYDKNFGSIFAFWDYFFGSLWLSNKDEKIVFGIVEHQQSKLKTLWQNLYQPFANLFKKP